MTLEQLYEAVDQLSQADRQKLKSYIDQQVEGLSPGEAWMA